MSDKWVVAATHHPCLLQESLDELAEREVIGKFAHDYQNAESRERLA